MMDSELSADFGGTLETDVTESGVYPVDDALTSAPDRTLFEKEVLAHRSELVAAGARLAGSRAEAEDLVQEAIMRAWLFFDRFQPGTNGRAWMHRILFNTFVNGYRKKRREREVLGQVYAGELHASAHLTTGQGAFAPVPNEALSDEVQAALTSLPVDFRRVIELVDLEERSYRDAALLLGCPIGTVMSRLHRARRAMKRELEGYAEAEGWRGETTEEATLQAA